MIWPPDSPWAPWWRTNKETAAAICTLARISHHDTVYDLGCGDGEVLMLAGKKYGAKGVGIEVDPLRFLISLIRVKMNGLGHNVVIKRKNLFEENVSNASVVVVYLVPKTLARLKPKFLKELKKGTRIVSFRYEIDLPLAKIDKKNNLHLYIIG